MQLTVSTLARPTIFISTSRQLGVSALRTRGGCTLPIAKSLLHLNTTKPYLQRPTSSSNLDVQSRLWPVPSSSILLQFASSPQLCPTRSISYPPFLHLQGWRLTHLQGWQLQCLQGWQKTSNTITTPCTILWLPFMHQCLTRHNNHFQILTGDDNNNDDYTVIASNCSPPAPLPSQHDHRVPTATPTTAPRPPTQGLQTFLATN
jgi:hypothetical protein